VVEEELDVTKHQLMVVLADLVVEEEETPDLLMVLLQIIQDQLSKDFLDKMVDHSTEEVVVVLVEMLRLDHQEQVIN
jgi:hypothetical protein